MLATVHHYNFGPYATALIAAASALLGVWLTQRADNKRAVLDAANKAADREHAHTARLYQDRLLSYRSFNRAFLTYRHASTEQARTWAVRQQEAARIATPNPPPPQAFDAAEQSSTEAIEAATEALREVESSLADVELVASDAVLEAAQALTPLVFAEWEAWREFHDRLSQPQESENWANRTEAAFQKTQVAIQTVLDGRGRLRDAIRDELRLEIPSTTNQ